ncbi:MAG: DUF565 domain-containing protein [Leptolyngbyaceae cyanobacterium RU_5_1]|nr:DUF565 domain-containing protein [Leptolyngbyaceae cyanobacterium RU_5_1]
MQNTRLNSVFDTLTARLGGWLRNPWRRLSVLIISLLLGNFLGSAVSTISGQRADLDVLVAGILVIGIELINRLVYGGKQEPRSLPVQILNALKMGLTYGLIVEAFKLGS